MSDIQTETKTDEQTDKTWDKKYDLVLNVDYTFLFIVIKFK